MMCQMRSFFLDLQKVMVLELQEYHVSPVGGVFVGPLDFLVHFKDILYFVLTGTNSCTIQTLDSHRCLCWVSVNWAKLMNFDSCHDTLSWVNH